MVKVKVLAAVVDGNRAGAVIDVSEKDAARLERIGYVERVAEPAAPVTKPTARKQPTANKNEK